MHLCRRPPRQDVAGVLGALPKSGDVAWGNPPTCAFTHDAARTGVAAIYRGTMFLRRAWHRVVGRLRNGSARVRRVDQPIAIRARDALNVQQSRPRARRPHAVAQRSHPAEIAEESVVLVSAGYLTQAAFVTSGQLTRGACGVVSHRFRNSVINLTFGNVAHVMQKEGRPHDLVGPPTEREFQMQKSKFAVAALMVAGVVAGQFAVVTSVEAKRAKCASVAVPGHPGTFHVVCSTRRP